MRDIIPYVLRKKDGSMVKEVFDYKKILDSIVEETGLSEEDSKKITTEVIRSVIIFDLAFVTAPMIREIACNVMLKLGYKEARYKYTRIGMPIADYKQIVEKYLDNTGQTDSALKFIGEIFNRIDFEYREIKKIIEGDGKDELGGDNKEIK